MTYEGEFSPQCGFCRAGKPHKASEHTAQCVVRALPVGETVTIDGHTIIHRRHDRFDLIAPNSRVRFGTLADIQEDLMHIAVMGCLPPRAYSWA